MPKIAIPRDERHAGVNTALRDESVGQPRFELLFDQCAAKHGGAPPIAGRGFDEVDIFNDGRYRVSCTRIRQRLRKRGGR